MWIRNQIDTGDQEFVGDDGNGETTSESVFRFAPTVTAAFGRGATDTDRTYVRLGRSDGTSVYIYVDTGTTVLCSTTKP